MEDFKVTLRMQIKATTRAPTHGELNSLKQIALKLDRAFQMEAQRLMPIVIGRRGEAGVLTWFELGVEGPSGDPPDVAG